MCSSMCYQKTLACSASDELQANLGHVCPTCELGVQPPLSIVRRHSLSVGRCVDSIASKRYLKEKKTRRQEPNQSGAWNRRNSLGTRRNYTKWWNALAITRKVIEARASDALSRSGGGRRGTAQFQFRLAVCRRKLRRERSPISRHNDRFRLPRACTRI